LELNFPGYEHVAELQDAELKRWIDDLNEAASLLHEVWPAASLEVFTYLRTIVPIKHSSWYVPGIFGLIALGVDTGKRQVRDMFHETIHHKLSRILEIASATSNPEHRVLSPFDKVKGPITSLLQSCWAFSLEYQLIQRLKAAGHIQPDAIAREELKFRVFFNKGIPLLRREAQLTELGDAIVSSIEIAVAV
jgi:HEXXH motif-containing protein